MALSALPGLSVATGNDSTPLRPGVRAPRGCSSESCLCRRRVDVFQTARTPVAWGPLGLWPTSNSTFWFSSRVRKPEP